MRDNAYYPSWKKFGKYKKYFAYAFEYFRFQDWKAMKASFNMVFLNKPIREEWIATSRMGKFRVRPGTTDFQFINYEYEKLVHEYLKHEFENKKLDLFIDIGACIGEYDIWLGNLGVNCIAFEPVNYKAIEQNIALNNLNDKVTVFSCGLGAKREKVNFAIMQTVTGSSHIDRNSDKEGSIDIYTFDSLDLPVKINPEEYVVIKLDVEHMETEVLEGAKEFIAKTKNLKIIFERFEGDDPTSNKLKSLGNFSFHEIDEVNHIAIKQE